MEKIKCGILGATGVVGQNYIKLLQGHPWFEIVDLAASYRNAGKSYSEAVKGRWHMSIAIPESIENITVRDVQDLGSISDEVKFVFSAVNMPTKEQIIEVENNYAKHGIPVVSNNSAHRWTKDVPMIIGEINPHHLDVISLQQKNNGFDKGGFIVVKPNCSLQSYLTPVFALEKAGFSIEKIILTTLQAISGAGYPGVPSFDMLDNIVPYIGGEEEKTEQEPLKILGTVGPNGIENYNGIKISANCTRVPVVDGHIACINIKFKDKIPSLDEIKDVWKNFKGDAQESNLPFAPEQPIIYKDEPDRPQPRLDRDIDKGMAVVIGRLRKDSVFDIKFVCLSHNTVRGAAGGGILNAESLVSKGFLK